MRFWFLNSKYRLKYRTLFYYVLELNFLFLLDC